MRIRIHSPGLIQNRAADTTIFSSLKHCIIPLPVCNEFQCVEFGSVFDGSPFPGSYKNGTKCKITQIIFKLHYKQHK